MTGQVDKLGELTLAEKAALLGGSDLWHTEPLEQAGIPAVMLSDGPHGLRVQYNEADHLGVEGSAPATCFPPAVAIASAWNPEIARLVGEALGVEARAAGVDVLLGPGINLKRTPLCGRNFEYYSEDPLLAGQLAAALVDGVQSKGVGTALKHFAANNQETERMSISVEADERTLRELYLSAFETVVTRARPWTVMCSYNRINGVFASENPWLLTTVLRDEWGFEGLVVSDWGAVYRRDRGVAAGLDLEMPSSSGAGTATILASVEAGTLAESDVDASARRVLELVDRVAARGEVEGLDLARQHEVARLAALEGAVLLKNDGDILPIDPTTGGPVAVIGEFARTPRFQGAGSSQVNAFNIDVPLEHLREGLSGRELRFAPGFRIDDELADAALVDEAVRTAEGAEVVLLFLGLPPSYESESFDREHLRLPAAQLELLAAVVAANPSVAVVLSNGGVVEVDPWQDRVPAVLEGWLLGEAAGGALADLLLGRVSPSGRLAETIPLRYEHNPTIGNFPGELGKVSYGERLLVGYRWYDAHGLDVAYPFGHGLTYSSFEYSELVVDTEGDTAVAELTVANTGARAAAEVVQLYVADLESTVERPAQELKAFAKVHLEPGESRRVRLGLPSRAFAFWHPSVSRWVVEGGQFELRIGASSRDIRLRATVWLQGERVVAPLSIDSPAGEWWDHPVVGDRVRELITGRYARLLSDPHEAPLFRPIPLARMVRFPGFTMTQEQALALAAELA